MATLTINGRKVTVDDKFRDLSPDEQNAAVEEIAQSLGPGVSTTEDVVKSGASGFARGTADLAGLPGTVGGYMESGLDWLKEKGYQGVTGGINLAQGEGFTPETPERGSFFSSQPGELEKANSLTLSNPLGGDSLRGALSRATGGATDYQPQTTAGEYARTVGEFAPSAIAAPGTILQKGAMATIPAAASETGGQITEGTAAEPYARLGGALVGGMAAAGRSPAPAKFAAKDAPTSETLKSAVDTAYSTLRDVGIRYDAGAFANSVQGMAGDLTKAGFRPSTAKQAFSLVDDLTKEIGKAKDFDDINALVSSTGATARDLRKAGQAQEAAAIDVVRDRLMQLEEVAPITSRIPLDRGRLNEVRGKVRELAFRNIKERVLQEVVDNADTYQAGIDAGIRNGVSNLLRSKRGQQMFKGEERKALLEVAQGRKGLQALSKFGFSFSKGSGNSTLIPLIGGLASAGLTTVGGAAAKELAPFFTGRALEGAKAAIRSGKLRDNSALDAAKAERLRVQIRRLLAAETGSQAAQPSAPGT